MSTAPFRPTGIDHVVIRATEPERMVAFYCNVLGCELERNEFDIGLIQLRAGVSLIDIVDIDGELGGSGKPPAAEQHNMDHLCLRIDPFDERLIRTYLAQHGVEAGELKLRYGAERYGPSIYIEDPEGNTIELKGPPEG